MPTDPTGPGLEIRPAVGSDVPQMALVHVRAREAAPMPESVHPAAEVQRWLAGRIAGDEAWVAVRGTRVLGYARFGPGWLDDLYVRPDAAREGIGGALLDVVKARLPEGFCLWVFETNAPARDFYARRGLVELERTDGSANEERTPDLRMAWPGAEPLAFLRAMIDDVDLVLGDVLARRAALTRAVQAVKPTGERDAAREAEIAGRVAAVAPDLGVERVARIVDVIISESIDAAG